MTQEEQIDRYFSGEMDDLEGLEFDKEVMSNKNLAAAVKEYKSLMLGLKTYGLKNKLHDIMVEERLSSENKDAKPKVGAFRWYYLLLALLAIIGLYITLKPASKTEESNSAPALYIAHYYPDPGLPTKMGDHEDFEFDSGMLEYKQGNYDNAIQHWTGISENIARTQYYIGAAYLASNQEQLANDQLEKLTSEDAYYDRAQWYLALVALKNDNVDAAGQHLKTILAIQQSNYKDRAKKLLDELPRAH